MFAHDCTAQPSERGRELVDQLDSAHWLDRDRAMHQLATFSDEFSLDELEFYLTDPTLSIEQRARVVQACEQRFREHPKGGLGVAFGAVSVGSIEVIPIQNNRAFPASTMLLPGDVIVRVGDEIMNNSFELRAQIISREPNELLPVKIIRAGKLLEMDLPLGSLAQLAGAGPLDPPLARRALELRWERKGIRIESPDTIGSTITLEQWTEMVFPNESTEEIQAAGRTLSMSMIAGVRRLVSVGHFAPRRVRTWMSREYFDKVLYKNGVRLTLTTLRNERVQRELLVLESEMISAQLENKNNSDRTDALASTLDDLRTRIELLDIKIAELEAEPDQSPKPAP